jgi:drug/metabolite transporter (DMT)-like permease
MITSTTRPFRLGLTTSAALVAFASNSILCRLALSDEAIDPNSFTMIRIGSGAAVLVLCATAVRERGAHRSGSWRSAAALGAYALAFSFAYVRLSAGTGALLLFGAVQLTIIAAALYAGERARALEWIGLASASAGLAYLSAPGLTAPPLVGSLLMIAAGVAWGLYTIQGRTVANPLRATTGNFVRSVPLVLVAVVVAAVAVRPPVTLSQTGILLAVASGGLTSALGYVVWYRALRELTALRAASVQLTVPVLAAVGGVVFLGERITTRLVLASLLILGGVAVTLLSRQRSSQPAGSVATAR